MIQRQLDRVSARAASDATFATVANKWLEKQRKGWSEIHYLKPKQAIERDVLPLLGSLPVAKITPSTVAATIKPIIQRGANETASKILWD